MTDDKREYLHFIPPYSFNVIIYYYRLIKIDNGINYK